MFNRFKKWKERRLYNRAINLLYDQESYWFLANNEIPKIGMHHANLRRIERERISRNVSTKTKVQEFFSEPGITGMYD